MTLRERIFLLIDKERINPNQFYIQSKLGNGYLDKIGDSLRKPTIEKIKKAFPHWNIDWVLQEKGEMINQSALNTKQDATVIRTKRKEVYLETNSGIKYSELSDNRFRMRVSLIPFNAYARFINETCESIQQEWDEVEFIVDRVGHGNYMAFEIKGDSMDDDSRRSFVQGDLVLARELDMEHWESEIKYNKYPYWIIVLNNAILCKEIINHNVVDGDITCHSLNPSPEYTDFTINLTQVCRLFNIIQKTSSTF